jgi:hypothetical protein
MPLGETFAVNHSEIVSFLWGVADLIRDTFKRGKYQDVILPLTVLRRLDCVLADKKQKVLAKQAELKSRKLENLYPQLCRVSGYAFYNTSKFDFEKLSGDAGDVARNLRNYIAGFSCADHNRAHFIGIAPSGSTAPGEAAPSSAWGKRLSSFGPTLVLGLVAKKERLIVSGR